MDELRRLHLEVLVQALSIIWDAAVLGTTVLLVLGGLGRFGKILLADIRR